ncbi:polysaccharide biosynthesis/export family protein [Desulfoferrobacter suflitae]|uniref:polysaccharide biosynthesis/export family protein n=1 Tax=Desulfoferrobacter suflitae TaxID=2865782 RepID=UPI002164DB4A|nr:polysaccharide export protein [Desulfoferrobacter suflitae]MCK8603905.1 polysaccharide export protein [Desulfoferrobacter suflitae]
MREGRWLAGLALALVVISLSGFGSAGCLAAEGDYIIAPSDVLEISVYGEEALTKGELVVRPDGKVSFPLIGDIQAAGKTTTQVKEAVEKKAKVFIPGAIANVSVTQLTSLQYYVLGKVAKPGMFNVSKPITVLQALALAGGPITFADEDKISVLRQEGDKTVRLPFNYKDVKKGRHLEQNIVLERGDVVVVP